MPGFSLYLFKDEKANHIPSLYCPSRAFFITSHFSGPPSAQCLIPQAQFSCLFINSPDGDAFPLKQAARSKEASFLLLVRALQQDWFLNLGIDCDLCGSAVWAIYLQINLGNLYILLIIVYVTCCLNWYKLNPNKSHYSYCKFPNVYIGLVFLNESNNVNHLD